MARIARWFIDITLDSETLRWWSGTGDVSLGGNTYTGLGTRWKTPDSLKRKASLKSEKIELDFDSSRQSDNSDPIGHLLDQKWRNRAVRVRRLAWDAGDGPDDGDVLEDERGRIRNLSDSLQKDKPATITMEIESGAISYLERRMETRSPASQKAVFDGDKGFDLIAQLEGVTLPWRTKYKKAGTRAIELAEEYEPYPRQLQIGRFVTEGSFVYADTNQQQRKSLVQVFALADHRINKLDRIWINGKLERSTTLTHGVRTLQRVENDKGEDRCWVTFYDGRPDQTADAFLVSVASTWTSAHRLRGVAYIIVEHRWDSDMANEYDYRFGGEGALLYDRRKDSTQGGSGSHRWDDPSTHEYSTNAMVAADHYRAGMRIMSGSDAMWFGVGEAPDAVPYAEFEELADHCDDAITLKAGGTQKRYEVNGTLSAEDDHAKNLEKLADQMAARAIDQGGRISIRPPIERSPVITLTDGDTIRGSDSEADPGGRIDDMVNTIDGRFINPLNDYKKDDFPKVQIAAYVEDDNGIISDTLNLDLENSGERAQRIAKLKIEDSRRIFEIEETYGAKARVIVPGEWFVRESVIRGYPSGKTFIAEEVERFIDGSIRVRSVEVDPDQLVWDEETAVDLSEPPAFPQLSLPDIEIPDIDASAVELGTAGKLTPGIRLDVTLPADLTELISDRTEMEYGISNGSGGISGQSSFLDFDPTRSVMVYAGFLPSTTYALRFRGIEYRGDNGKRYGDWSAVQTVTTTANATASTAGSASVVPWSGVTGSGKPADNADVTGDNTAAGIVGQGTLATASQVLWASQVTGTGKPENDATKSRVFRQSGTPSSPNVNDIWVVLSGSTPIAVRAWNGSAWITGADLTSINIAAGFLGQDWGATAGEDDASNDVVRQESQRRNLLPPQYWMFGEKELIDEGSVVVSTANATPAGNSLPNPYSGLDSAAWNGAGNQAYINLRLAKSVSDANMVLPAGTYGYKIAIRVNHAIFTSIDIRLRSAAAAVLDSEIQAIASINNNLVIEGTLELSSPAEAYLEVRFNGSGTVTSSHRVYLLRSQLEALPAAANGPGDWSPDNPKLAWIEDRADVTGNNDSAGFTGQGSQATANHQRGATYSGTPTEGSWWADTSSDELKLYTGGAWNVVATLVSTAPDPLRITLSSGSLSASRADAGALSVNPVFAGAGGTGPYTFSYTPITSALPMTGPDPTFPDLVGSGITVSANSASNNVQSRWTVLVTMTDTSDGSSVTTPFGGTLTWGIPP